MRANYQTTIWRNAHLASPGLPSPDGCGWTIGADDQLEIDWTGDKIMPKKLVDILTDRSSGDEELQDEVEEDDVIDNIIDDIFDDGDDDDDAEETRVL